MYNKSYYTSPRSDMLKYLPKDAKRILEVGCGEGTFLSQIKEEVSAEIWAVEIGRAHV